MEKRITRASPHYPPRPCQGKRNIENEEEDEEDIGEGFSLANYKREHIIAEDGAKEMKVISPLDYTIETDNEELNKIL